MRPSPYLSDRHQSTQQIMRWFDYRHLPDNLQEISKLFGDLAAELVVKIADGPELTAGLRKLLEAKDCMVRAKMDSP